jgi:hypothetical protein
VSTRGDHASLFVPVDGTAGQVARVELDLRRDGSHKPQARELEVWSGTRRVGGCAIATDDCRRLRVDVPLTGTGPRFQALTLRPAPAGVRLRVVLQGIRVAAPSE